MGGIGTVAGIGIVRLNATKARTDSPRAIGTIAAIAAAALILAGCVHTELPEQTIQAAPAGAVKLPIFISVMSDVSLEVGQLGGFKMELNPGLANTLRDALAVHFEKVDVVYSRDAPGNADLLAIPVANMCWSKVPCKLSVTFKDLHTGKTVANLSSEMLIDSNAPGHHQELATDTAVAGTALLIFPPLALVSLPLIEHHDADRFKAMYGPTLVTLASDISGQASNDPAIESLAAQQAASTAKQASATTSRKH
ncbi:MAG TPA: hypothetical protein VMV15_09810 [Candidatus Binataceae bacterium]|nr:hypothetical protein [Candidatus Binataceae bacterium]